MPGRDLAFVDARRSRRLLLVSTQILTFNAFVAVLHPDVVLQADFGAEVRCYFVHDRPRCSSAVAAASAPRPQCGGGLSSRH